MLACFIRHFDLHARPYVFVLVAQIYAAKKFGTPLDASQLPTIRRLLGNAPSIFTDERVRKIANEISAML